MVHQEVKDIEVVMALVAEVVVEVIIIFVLVFLELVVPGIVVVDPMVVVVVVEQDIFNLMISHHQVFFHQPLVVDLEVEEDFHLLLL